MALIVSPLLYMPFLLALVGILSLLFRSDARLRKRCIKILGPLSALSDVRAVGPLVNTLKMDYRGIHRVAVAALIDLLPRLRASEADLLNAEQRGLLCRQLSKPLKALPANASAASQEAYIKAVAFRVAILQAFAQVGDSSALPLVERLAHGEATTRGQRAIQEAARQCLPALMLRAEQERNGQTLLRAANAADAEGETLLRAAKGARETRHDQLLRPGPPAP